MTLSDPPLVTARLVLEPLLPAHADALFASLQDERLYRFIPTDPPVSLATLTERYTRLARRQSPDGRETWLNWAIRHVAWDAYVGLTEATLRPDGTCYIAYSVFPDYWQQGIAREACEAMLARLTVTARPTRLVAEVDTRNAASIGLLQALGFTRVATTADADWFKGATSHEHRFERPGLATA